MQGGKWNHTEDLSQEFQAINTGDTTGSESTEDHHECGDLVIGNEILCILFEVDLMMMSNDDDDDDIQ